MGTFLYHQARWLRFLVAVTLVATLTLHAAPPPTAHAAPAGTFTNSATITIGVANATPYPATIMVSGITAPVVDMTVSLFGFEHAYPLDVDILLVGPNGQGIVLMSENGGSTPVTGVDLTFDELGEPLPSVLTSGNYQPQAAQFLFGGDFDSPAPTEPHSTTFEALFDGMNPNGEWSLYVRDTFSADTGSITGGWSLSFHTLSSISVTPTSGLETNEDGAGTVFEVVLSDPPRKPVFIPLSSSDTSEGTVTPSGLTFTSANWNVPQSVFVLGADDSVDDGDIGYSIVTGAAISLDPTYNGVEAADVSITNLDNDTAGISVTPTTGLITTETGGTATFSVVLLSQPTGSVIIGLSSSDTTEGRINRTGVTFTPATWNTPQIVTITGQNDTVADGDQAYTIVTAPATSSDANYIGRNAADVNVTNTDDDAAGIVVSPISGNTTEAGGTATFSVVLQSQPTNNVLIGLSSSDAGEGIVSPGSLTFTPGNWNLAQTVTVTGQDDFVDDGDQTYTILTSSSSDDPLYDAIDPADRNVTNIDNDGAGITITPPTGTTTEAGGTASFTIVLNSQPLSNVTIGFTSSDLTEGDVTTAAVVFTPATWNTPQPLTDLVMGVDDAVDDGDQAYTIIVSVSSGDAGYNGIPVAPILMTNTDDDTAGITVTPTSGLETTEASGEASFTVVLDSEPTNNVTIALTSSDVTEGLPDQTLLTFTPGNWDSAQTVTITGQNDFVDDDDQPYSIITTASSMDPLYQQINPADVSVINRDDDAAGIIVQMHGDLVTTESGGTASFSVVLASQPTADVTLPTLSSSDTSEGTLDKTSLSFTPDNWNIPQVVTITGQNDDQDDGNIGYTIGIAASVSGDPLYNGIDPANPPVTNVDDDTAGVNFNPVSLVTSEAGDSATFTVVLTSEPTSNVTINLQSSDTTEGTVAAPSLLFTPDNWDELQSATVTGVDDDVDDGNIDYCITATSASSDPNYNDFAFECAVAVTNTDDDGVGITVTPLDASAGLPTEAGGTANFSVVLDSQPTANVVISLSSSDTTEGTVRCNAIPSLTFTPSNWNTPQVCTITGVDDFVDDGDVEYTIILAPAISDDPLYDAEDPADVAAVTLDNDTAGIKVEPISGLETTEAGGSDTFTVVLTSEPTADVTVTLASNDETEGTASPTPLTFTAGNWDQPQTVTVTGVNDDADDGNQPYSVVTTASSTDPLYAAINPDDVGVMNIDNDIAGITVAPNSGLFTGEGGTTATFTVVLNSQPTTSVTIPLIESSDTTEGTVSPTSLTFTRTNWNQPRPVTVRGVDDNVDDGNIVYQITIGATISGDPLYNGIELSDLTVTNVDDDTAGMRLTPDIGLVTGEDGTSDTLTVRLTSEPADTVTVALTSSDTTEGTLTPSSLTFTALNWNNPRPVTVKGVDDTLVDGSQTYAVVAEASSSDPLYNVLDPVEAGVINIDNEVSPPGVVITPITGLETTEAGGTDAFVVVLNSQPAANVTLTFTSDDLSEGTVLTPTLTFTPATWTTARLVAISGVDDSEQDGDQAYTISTTVSSADPGYNSIAVTDVAVTNLDNDAAGITVSPISRDTTESGGTATFTVGLVTPPTSNVAITVSSNDTTEGTVTCGANPLLTFTPANWNQAQTCTVTGVNDNVDDGDMAYSIILAAAVSNDPAYANNDPADVLVINSDDDTAGIVVTPASGLITTEGGATDTFTVVLTSEPTANVIIGLNSSDTSEGTVSPANLTFTASNWNRSQTVTVKGVDDNEGDGNVAYTIVTSSSSADLLYNRINPADVSVTNRDPGEGGDTNTFRVYLPLMLGAKP